MYMKTQSSILYFEQASLTRDMTWSKFYENRENIRDQKLSAEHTH